MKPLESNPKVPYVVGSKSPTAVAINCASKAGEWIKSKLGGYGELGTKLSSRDLVTDVDKGAEAMIRKLILTHFPDHSILGEEGVAPGAAASAAALAAASEAEYLWIVDPIDGTTNFVHGFPFFCVSIALAYRGEVTVGVIYDPMRDELFLAEKGKGAYMHGQKCKVSAESVLSDSVVAVGFNPDREFALPTNMRGLNALSGEVRSLRAAGSAALHLAYVAAGRLSGYYEVGLNAWDVAAGALIVAESGGIVTDTVGNPYDIGVRHLAASNGKIHNELLGVLKSADATGM
ncbi:inositol monophosphatase family protein [Paenibacillus macerans]|uniref:inositol monophosphatase family protein n=1 Tax=Paenibacillus macerans TaxID=44252 RepID=UPI0006917773|nr:inositol monophosphatase family protein [Paenibacillus macerans]MCY7558131.1 inositol monophosphatase [Paenibacillus macerans]MEC0153739.1 inositol monophosphatase family protein [Paenibacillus macerans]